MQAFFMRDAITSYQRLMDVVLKAARHESRVRIGAVRYLFTNNPITRITRYAPSSRWVKKAKLAAMHCTYPVHHQQSAIR